MRRIMIPAKLLAWIEVDLDSGEVVDVRCSDYLENYEAWPADDEKPLPGVDSFSARGLVNIDDFPEGDFATDEQSIKACQIVESKPWPCLRIEVCGR